MKQTLIISVVCLAIGFLIGTILTNQRNQKNEKFWFTQLITERIDHNLITAKAIRRNDRDDIFKIIEGQIALEYSEYLNGHYNKEWRNEFFIQNNVVSKIKAYCKDYPESKLTELFTEKSE